MSRENREQLANFIQEKVGESPLPPSQDGRDAILNAEIPETDIDFETLKKLFPDRYNMCLRALQVTQRVENIPESLKEYIRKRLLILNNLDRYIEKHKTGQEATLKERQFTVFEDIRDFLEGRKGRMGEAKEAHEESTDKRGYVKLPTGVGKTVLFTEMIEAMIGEETEGDKMKDKADVQVLIVVPRNTLISQTNEKIGQFAEQLDIGQINGDGQRVGRHGLIITYDSLRNRIADGRLNPKDFDVVILDEAHRALGEKTQASITHEGFEDAIMLGFTATPTFSERKKVSNILPHEIHNMNIKEAVELDLLSGFRTIVAKTKTDLRQVRITNNGEFNAEDLEKAINTEARNLAIIKLYQQGFMGEKAIGYCHKVAHAERLAQLFNEKGIPAGYVYGNQPKTEQEEILKKHKRGEILVLFNAKLLIEGYDDPSVTVGINVSPSLSLVDVEQRGGRPLRSLPDKFATIIDVIDETDAKRHPILFAEVAGAAAIPRDAAYVQADTQEGQPGKIKKQLPTFEIEGVEVIVESQMVAQYVSTVTKERRKKEESDIKVDTEPKELPEKESDEPNPELEGFHSVEKIAAQIGLGKSENWSAVTSVINRLKIPTKMYPPKGRNKKIYIHETDILKLEKYIAEQGGLPPEGWISGEEWASNIGFPLDRELLKFATVNAKYGKSNYYDSSPQIVEFMEHVQSFCSRSSLKNSVHYQLDYIRPGYRALVVKYGTEWSIMRKKFLRLVRETDDEIALIDSIFATVARELPDDCVYDEKKGFVCSKQAEKKIENRFFENNNERIKRAAEST